MFLQNILLTVLKQVFLLDLLGIEIKFIHGLIGILVVCLALVFNFFIIGTLTLDFINGDS